ncbi:MAG: LPXTG cell wall anchor domain-containing protein, partial [Clostridia bacterium]|nr:LPXTG cell wall anchor domain-containing protein [Clostridia bacterium]
GDSNYGAYGAFEFNETVAGDCQTAPKGNMVCSLCGFTSPETNKPGFVAKNHVEGTPVESDRVEATCTEDGSYVKTVSCTECGKELSKTNEVITAIGHDFEANAEVIADCKDAGTVAYNHCTVCEKNFAADADKMSTEELSDADLILAVDPNVHRCEIVEAKDATCTEDGNIKYSKCKKCGLLFDSETGADLTSEEVVVETTGHTLTEVKEVAATTEKEGTKAHYACSECGKLFTDADGKTETTAEELVIAKIVVEDKKDENAEDNKTETKPEGDKSDESPKTGETVATVALAIAALMGVAFVIIRKARKA